MASGGLRDPVPPALGDLPACIAPPPAGQAATLSLTADPDNKAILELLLVPVEVS
jgi:hypothetical protein